SPAIGCPLRPESDQARAAVQYVAKGHFRTHVSQQTASSFDHVVCKGEKRGRDREAKRLCSLEVDYQFELGRLLNREIGRLGAFENFIDVVACMAEDIGYIGAV